MSNKEKINLQKNKKLSVNLLSSAHTVKATGPGSAWREFLKNFKNKPFTTEYNAFVNRKKDADIIHVNSPDPRYKWKMRRGVYRGIVVFNVHFIPGTHTDTSYDPKNFFHFFIVNKIIKWSNYFLQHADELVVVNPMFIDDLMRIGVKRENITYIPNVVHASGFHKVSAAEKKALRKQYNFFPEDKIVVSVGQLQTRKGVKEFIDVAKKLPDVKFIWLGSFAFKKLSHGHKEIEEFVSNPPENVFFKGRVPIEQVNEYLNCSDIFFMPALSELFPMSILEAANVGIPMVLRDLPEYAEIFNFTKYLKANNNQDFANIIEETLNNQEKYRAAEKVSKAIASKYSADIISGYWDKYYKRISNKYADRLADRTSRTSKKNAKKRYR